MSGLAHEQGFGGGLGRPLHLPAQVVDHATGYLAALGALMALARRAREGGSYLVRVSLVQTGRWVDGSGGWPAATWPTRPRPTSTICSRAARARSDGSPT